MLLAATLATAAAVVAVVAGAGLVWARQERIVWQPPRVGPGDRATPAGAERVDLAADDGAPLLAYVVRPPRPAAAAGTLIAFHGNAEIAAWGVPWARQVARRTGYTVVLPEYRGYAGLPGRPSYARSRVDARAAHAAVLAAPGAASADVVLFGHSLGSAVAAELAEDLARAGTPPRALVLQAPFTSARAMARIVVSPAAARWWDRIARVHFDTEAIVAALDVPVSIAHGTRDLIVPARMGRRVHAAARRPGELLLVDGAGHNDVEVAGGARYWEWLERALAAGARRPGGAAPGR